jgi:DNA-binding GntR family transcriptional regulator
MPKKNSRTVLNFSSSVAIWMKVYDHLRKKILIGDIPPETRLVEATIAKEIGTSRTPVREALHNMQREGLVKSIPRVGYIVRPLIEEEIAQICAIRGLLETQAAVWAVQKQKKQLVLKLEKNLSISRERIANRDFASFITLDEQFHETIARLSDSTFILDIAKMARQHMLRARMTSLYNPDAAARSLEGHRLILQAIKTGEPYQIRKAIEGHLEVALQDITSSTILPKHEIASGA